jgi:carboxylesterase type B
MYPQYNMARFVQLSTQLGMPIIAVSLNYRLGAPGLLISTSLREKGYRPNNTLRDQRTALLWLHQHIAGFGGDPENITLAGESAGGISVCYHLFSQEPLYKRMISMSGTQLLMPPIPPEVAETHYERAIKALGLEDGDKAIETLARGLDGREMAGKLMGAGIPNIPVLDDELCPTSFNFESIEKNKVTIPGQNWCEAAVIGDCQFDGNIQSLRLGHRKKDIASAFCASISASLSSHPGLAEKLFDAYGLKPETADEEAFERVLTVANDLNFYLPTLSLAQNLSGAGCKTYMYRFNEPNPWEGAWKGHATHILDITFLLQNFNEFLSEEQRGVAEGFAKDVISFVNGRQPWEEWKQAKVLGPEGKVEVVEDLPEKVGRRDIMLNLGREVGVDTINEAFDAFMKGAKPAHAS